MNGRSEATKPELCTNVVPWRPVDVDIRGRSSRQQLSSEPQTEIGVELTRSLEVRTCKLDPQEPGWFEPMPGPVQGRSRSSGEAEIACRSCLQSPGQKPAGTHQLHVKRRTF